MPPWLLPLVIEPAVLTPSHGRLKIGRESTDWRAQLGRPIGEGERNAALTRLAGLLRGARAMIAQETEEGQRWAESRIKALTGGDPISARFMRQDFFTFTPAFKLMIAGNHKPSLRVDDAVKRRFYIMPFTVTVPTAERDAQLQRLCAIANSRISESKITFCQDSCNPLSDQAHLPCLRHFA